MPTFSPLGSFSPPLFLSWKMEKRPPAAPTVDLLALTPEVFKNPSPFILYHPPGLVLFFGFIAPSVGIELSLYLPTLFPLSYVLPQTSPRERVRAVPALPFFVGSAPMLAPPFSRFNTDPPRHLCHRSPVPARCPPGVRYKYGFVFICTFFFGGVPPDLGRRPPSL